MSQERQISVVRELLNDKNRTLLDDKDRERLAFLSTDFPPSPYEASVKRSLSLIVLNMRNSTCELGAVLIFILYLPLNIGN